MKAALCSPLWCVEPGPREAKHHCFTTGKVMTSSRPLVLSVFLPYVISRDCILISGIRTSAPMILCFLSRSFLFTFQKVLFWFWIAGLCIAGAQDVCKREFSGRIKIKWLPAYVPELNPVEQIWNYSKYSQLSNFIPADIEYLADMLDTSLCHQSKQQNLLRSFFHCARLKI